MYADPQTVTINAVPKTLARTGSTDNSGKFATPDRAVKLEFNHQYGKRVRHQSKLTSDSLVANPLISGQNINQSMSVYIVADVPAGYDTVAAKQVVDAFVAFLSASSGAAVTRLLGGES